MQKKHVIALFLVCLFSLSCLVLSPGEGFAAMPKTINFQGKLIDKMTGLPKTDVTEIKFLLYNTPDGMDELWYDTIYATPDANGIFNVTLGPGGNPLKGNLDIVDFSRPLYLELYIGSQTLTPRQPLSASPYAFYAITAESVVGSAPAGGWTNSSGKVVLTTTTDKVGIGTANPSETLEVNGTAKANALAGAWDHSASGTGYVRIGNMQICWGTIGTITHNLYGTPGWYYGTRSVTFPATFKSGTKPSVSCNPDDNTDGVFSMVADYEGITNTGFIATAWAYTSAVTGGNNQYIAIGVWQ